MANYICLSKTIFTYNIRGYTYLFLDPGDGLGISATLVKITESYKTKSNQPPDTYSLNNQSKIL